VICDLCKPINEGEGSTVRIVMSLDEAQGLLHDRADALAGASIQGDSVERLLLAIERAVQRADGLVPTATEPSLAWYRDPAASGWRSRAFLPNGELLAYDDGDWEIRLPGVDVSVAGGHEPDLESAKARAVLVHNALTMG